MLKRGGRGECSEYMCHGAGLKPNPMNLKLQCTKIEIPANHWKSKKCRQNNLLEEVRIQNNVGVQAPVMRVEPMKLNEFPNETIFHQMSHE